MSKRGLIEVFTWWKLWLLFGFRAVLWWLFPLLYFLQYRQPKKFRFPRTLRQKVGSVYLILTIPGSPSCVARAGPADSGRCGPLISNHRGRHERSLWRHERYHPQLLCYVPSAPGPWHGNRISLVPFHEILVSSGIWMLFICFDFWFLGISLHLFIFLTDACLFVCKM